MKTTGYFKNSVLTRRPDLNERRLEFVVENPVRSEVQDNGRTRHWAFISEAGKYLRVVVEPDGVMVHNAFFDQGFKK